MATPAGASPHMPSRAIPSGMLNSSDGYRAHFPLL
eukprot:CAMPEP_0206279080 /NCGR_PEP_ID=MMETSP0047_2-20121206/37835_1 /ASSEMBLY_ACC=CAM_ASM_000192 /TAXON_ID=195065 /ORGANISM="Chroomonas mesostigmatica_cf, Strain CCMP1168" /LENGTH=34 /DNA_ID= /DNA_START= /DNA_END= /DNA_ORIENTATION=